MANANKLAKNSLFYTISRMVTKASSFLLLFVYTNPVFLSTEDYGRVNLLTSFVNIAALFVTLSLSDALMRFYPEYKDDKEKCKRFFGTVVTFSALFAVLSVFLLIFLREPLGRLFFSGIEIYPPVIASFLTLCFMAVFQMYTGILQAKQEGKKSAKVSLAFVFVHIVMNLVFLIFGRGVNLLGFNLGGLNGMMLSLCISNLIFALYGFFCMIKNDIITVCIDFVMLKTALRYCLPLLPHNAANSVAFYIPKHFLNAAGKAFENGVYSVSMQFSSIIDIFQSSVQLALRPWFNDKMRLGENGRKEINEITSIAFRISAIVCLGVALFSQEVIMFLNNNYYDAWKTVPIIAVAHAIKFIYFTHTFGVMYDLRHSNKMILCSGSAIVVNFILSFTLTELGLYNMYAAAISFLVSRSVAALVSVIICRKYDIIKFNMREMLTKVFQVAAFSVAGIIPINVFYVGLENQIEVFSAEFFINILFKLFVFAIGVIIIIGKQRKEVLSFAKSMVKKKSSSKNSEGSDA